VQKHHPIDQIIGDLNTSIQTRRRLINPPTQACVVMLSMMEPKDFSHANQDDNWIKAMNEEFD